MKTKTKIFAAALVAGVVGMFAAAPAHADSLQVSFNVGDRGYYRPAPAPVVRPAVVREAVIYRPVYRPAPRVVYVQPRGWHHGHWNHDNHGRYAYGYGRGW